jgi:hypothetical protein
MKEIDFGRWKLICDPESTAVSQGSPEKCGCEPCLNFAAARDQTYGPNVRALFANPGISFNREAEIYHMARLESGRHLYAGRFHFVGTIISGADAAKQIGERNWQPDLERTTDDFNLGFSSRVALIRKPFAGLPIVQLEFSAKVPWVLACPAPQ